MNVLLNFRNLIINNNSYSDDAFSEVTESEEVDEIAFEFQKMNREIRRMIPEGDFDKCLKDLAYDDEFRNLTKSTLIDIVNDNLSIFNCNAHGSYLWLDEICTIIIDKGQAIIMDDKSDYADLDSTKRAVQRAVQIISDSDPNFDLNKYCDVYFVIYVDIIGKSYPITIIKSRKS